MYTDMILMLLPVAAIQLGLFVYCAVKIFKEGVGNLNKWVWLLFSLNLLGALIFLVVGRKKDAQ